MYTLEKRLATFILSGWQLSLRFLANYNLICLATYVSLLTILQLTAGIFVDFPEPIKNTKEN